MAVFVTHLVPVIGLDGDRSLYDTCNLRCNLSGVISHSRSRLQPSAGRPPGGSRSVHHLSLALRTPDPPVDKDRCALLMMAFAAHLQVEASHLQVRNTLCNLVFRLQNESVMNFCESISRSDSQDLWGATEVSPNSTSRTSAPTATTHLFIHPLGPLVVS